MGTRKLCKTTKTGKTVPHRKDGKCPKGSVEKTIRTKGKSKKRSKKRSSKKRK